MGVDMLQYLGVRIRGSDQNQSVSFRFHHMPKIFFSKYSNIYDRIHFTRIRSFVERRSARMSEI